MLESLKIDIIYYGTPSDFEMEFNLGGCARCRILNTSTSSAKETVKALATAVGRSRVILITGPLFGNQALLSLIPRAVGLPCEPVDKAAFSISSTGDIEIPQGPCLWWTATAFSADAFWKAARNPLSCLPRTSRCEID